MTGRLRSRGLSLVETMVAASLGVIFLGMLFSFLVPSFRAATRASVRTDLQQIGVLSVNKVVADMETTAVQGVSLSSTTGQVIVGLQPLQNVAADGTQIWDNQAVLYVWSPAARTLIRKRIDPSVEGLALSPAQAQAIPPDILGRLASDPTTDEAVLSRDVVSFSVVQGTGTNFTMPFIVTLAVSRLDATGSTTPEQFNFTRTVSLRNRNS